RDARRHGAARRAPPGRPRRSGPDHRHRHGGVAAPDARRPPLVRGVRLPGHPHRRDHRRGVPVQGVLSIDPPRNHSMMPLTAQDKEKILSFLETRLEPKVYDTWCRSLELEPAGDNAYRVPTANPFYRDWLEKLLRKPLEDAFANL